MSWDACRVCAEPQEPISPKDGPIQLFNGKNLDGLYTWLEDTKYDDLRKVFTVQDGLLRISGDGMGYVATKKRYTDYHLVLEYRWGDLTWGARKTAARDSGIIFHCLEADGAYLGQYMAGLEAQIYESGTGDFEFIPDTRPNNPNRNAIGMSIEAVRNRRGEYDWRKGAPRLNFPYVTGKGNWSGRSNWFGHDIGWKNELGYRGRQDIDSPGKEWTRLDLICDGGHILYYVNNTLANEGFDARPTSGKITLQSELAELFIRRFELLPLKKPQPIALWDKDLPFPTRQQLSYPAGAVDVVVHRAGADGYFFLHDPAIVRHKDFLLAAWYNCPRGEMVGESLIRGRRSRDGGRCWSDVEVIAADVKKQGILYVPVAFLSHGGSLYAFVANMQGGPDRVRRCEVFVLDERDDRWQSRGFIAGPFLPNCAPQKMGDGSFLMAGRMAAQPGELPTIPAVAVSRGEKITEPWSLVRLLPTGRLPDGRVLPCPETTAIVDRAEITAVVRREKGNSLLFRSSDHGRSWSAPQEHNLPMAWSKVYAGMLSTSQRYLLCNVPCGGSRDLLVIAVSRPGETAFCRMWKLRDGPCAALKCGPQWSYPVAIEHEGKLSVVYTSETHHCVMTTIPVKSLVVE